MDDRVSMDSEECAAEDGVVSVSRFGGLGETISEIVKDCCDSIRKVFVI